MTDCRIPLHSPREVMIALLSGGRLVHAKYGSTEGDEQWLEMGEDGHICEEDGAGAKTHRVNFFSWRETDPQWQLLVRDEPRHNKSKRPNADIMVRINARRCYWTSDRPAMSYHDVLVLSGAVPHTNYTMTWHYRDAEGQHGGSLSPDSDSVMVHEGMGFDFALTNGA
jgi:hypothetical protein